MPTYDHISDALVPQVAYTPQIGGDYFISITIDGLHIHGSPFTASSDPLPREAYLEVYRLSTFAHIDVFFIRVFSCFPCVFETFMTVP